MKKINYIKKDNFKKYGYILDFTGEQESWEILFKENSSGFRIAIFEIDRKKVDKLERHPDSLETFEPMSGVSLILLSENNPEDFDVFLLDKPICLKKGIWHEVITISERSKFKIVENNEVQTEFYNLKSDFTFFVDYEE